MGMKSPCGNAVPVLNPPNFGPGIRQQTCSCASQPNVPYPTDPSDLFPRVITDSSVAWQGTSLGTEPGAASGWDPRFPRALCMRDRVLASYEDAGLNYAASQISDLISKVMYPIPGIWLGPVYVHSPSGNVVLHLSVPRGGPYDPIPVFTPFHNDTPPCKRWKTICVGPAPHGGSPCCVPNTYCDERYNCP